MESKRSINNKSYLFCFTTIILCFALGYILLVSMDKIENVNLKQLFFSAYTVFTQFGMMIFPIVIIHSINKDYKEKNILFYQTIGIEAPQYFLRKLGVMILWFTSAIILVITIICLLYGDFSEYYIMLIYFENAIIYIILISSCLAFVFNNILFTFCMNLLIWITSIILLTIFPKLYFIAYFDASNILYINLGKYLETSNMGYLSILQSCLYNFVLFLFVFCFVCLMRKKWIKNGV